MYQIFLPTKHVDRHRSVRWLEIIPDIWRKHTLCLLGQAHSEEYQQSWSPTLPDDGPARCLCSSSSAGANQDYQEVVWGSCSCLEVFLILVVHNAAALSATEHSYCSSGLICALQSKYISKMMSGLSASLLCKGQLSHFLITGKRCLAVREPD